MILGNQNSAIPYGIENIYNASRHPSAIHTDSGLKRYFERYLIQKIISVYEFDGIPDTWSKDYFYYSLFVWGYVAVIETNKYGIIPQWCTLKGRDVFYRPTNAVISNPLLRGLREPEIGVQCSLIRMQPDYGGAWDIVSFYADMLTLSSQTAAINLLNSKLSYVFTAQNKQAAESLKKLYDKIASGEPAAIVDRSLFTDDGRPLWETFNQNLSQNYIAGDIMEDMAKWDSRFCTEIGIPNVNIAKESGVGDSEIQANNFDTKSKASLWLDTIREGLEQTNNLFGTNISVKFRWEETENAEISNIDNGNV